MKRNKTFFSNKVVLITGAAGSIGSAIVKQLMLSRPKKIVMIDQDETGIFDLYEEVKDKILCDYVIASIRDAVALNLAFNQHKPHIVFHAAAYKHVKLMERYPDEAYKTNVKGTENVLDACRIARTQKIIFISSDKAVNATSIMGKTKMIGEDLVLQDSRIAGIVVRFGNVMPSRGSIVPIFQKQIAENRPLTVTDKRMMRYFMSIHDAAALVIKAAEIGKKGDIIVLDMGEQISIADLARLMIKISGKSLPIVYTKPNKGEKFTEELMTKEEKKKSKKIGQLYVISSKQ